MRYIPVLLIALFSISAFAQVGSGMCQFSFHSDSYGRGIESAFTGEDLRSARIHDEACYQLGYSAAQEAITANSRFVCNGEFKDGYKQGIVNSPYGAGVACYNLGFSAGRGALGIGAREGNATLAGEKCVKAYKLGRADAKAGRSSAPTTSEPELYCYGLGQFEAELF